jgi:uncharacterized membrane protein YgaE (UPF0421/DUF939 family)
VFLINFLLVFECYNKNMFFRSPGKPTRLKQITYIIAAIILGLILSLIIHAFIEIGYLQWAENKSLTVSFYNGCALTPLLQIILMVLGAISGFFLGHIWWRKIYIERSWIKG